jgi:hypothetical protein
MYKFETKEDYNKWQHEIISKIYYANIACNDSKIREAVKEISSKLWLAEGEELIQN